MTERIAIYCDGACRPNPGAGGWGVVVVQDGVKRELSGGFRNTTNMGAEGRQPDRHEGRPTRRGAIRPAGTGTRAT